MNISADILDLLGRFGIDILTMLILVGVLYRSQQSVPSMPLVLSSLNIGLFAALAAMTQGNFPAAIGFGLGYGAYDYGYGYPYYANYGYDDGYYGDGGCYIVQRRVLTPYGWSFRPVQVCN